MDTILQLHDGSWIALDEPPLSFRTKEEAEKYLEPSDDDEVEFNLTVFVIEDDDDTGDPDELHWLVMESFGEPETEEELEVANALLALHSRPARLEWATEEDDSELDDA